MSSRSPEHSPSYSPEPVNPFHFQEGETTDMYIQRQKDILSDPQLAPYIDFYALVTQTSAASERLATTSFEKNDAILHKFFKPGPPTTEQMKYYTDIQIQLQPDIATDIIRLGNIYINLLKQTIRKSELETKKLYDDAMTGKTGTKLEKFIFRTMYNFYSSSKPSAYYDRVIKPIIRDTYPLNPDGAFIEETVRRNAARTIKAVQNIQDFATKGGTQSELNSTVTESYMTLSYMESKGYLMQIPLNLYIHYSDAYNP